MTFLLILLSSPFTYLFMLLGLLAIPLSRSNKRWICVLYVLGLLLEEAVYRVYVQHGILEEQWALFYLCIALVDITILALMTHCYHRDYILAYPVIFLMVCVKATIPMEWVLMHSTSVWSISENALQALNFALLLILFGRSDGILRLITSIRHRLLSNSIEHSQYRIRLEPSEGNTQKMETGTCKT